MRTIDGLPRGCGNLKPGGCYVQGSLGANGSLAAWTWALGSGVFGGDNLFVEAPARTLTGICLPSTLATRALATDVLETYPAPLDRLPKIALLDHVGQQHYTPWFFYRETVARGPSRRIPPDVAAKIAPHTPIPIVFTHNWIPTVTAQYADDLLTWAEGFVATSLDRQPTWLKDTWGLYRDDTHGDDHWLIPVLRRLDERCDGYRLDGSQKHPGHVPAHVVEHTLLDEQVLGISWVTDVVYMTTGDESDEDLESWMQKGIEPVRVGDNERES